MGLAVGLRVEPLDEEPEGQRQFEECTGDPEKKAMWIAKSSATVPAARIG
jgi:hypothetical protein